MQFTPHINTLESGQMPTHPLIDIRRKFTTPACRDTTISNTLRDLFLLQGTPKQLTCQPS